MTHPAGPVIQGPEGVLPANIMGERKKGDQAEFNCQGLCLLG